MSERMERKKRQKRNAIIDKAERIMAKKGYWDMTMDEVAADADVAKGTIYLYFSSKESLCAAVIARIIADMNGAIREKLDGVEKGSERMKETIGAVIQWNVSHPEKSRVLDNVMMLRFKDQSDPNVREYIARTNEQLQIMQENFEQAIAEGFVRPDVEPISTTIFLRMAFWVAMNPFPSHEIVMAENGVDRKALVNTALELIIHATSAETPGSGSAGTRRARAKS